MKIKFLGKEPSITIRADVLHKFDYIQSKYNMEFTAFCHIEEQKDTYYIYDIFFPRQDNTLSTTECNSEDVIALIGEGFDLSKGMGHMHSHVNMGVFASLTDETDIIERAKDAPFNAALIYNKKGEIYGHIVDSKTGIYYQEVAVYIEYPADFDNDKLNLLKICKNWKEAASLLRKDDWTFYKEMYGLDNNTKKYLDSVIKTKFHMKSYSNLPSTQRYNNNFNYNGNWKDEAYNPVYSTDTIDNEEYVETFSTYDEDDIHAIWNLDPGNLLSTEELQQLQIALDKPAGMRNLLDLEAIDIYEFCYGVNSLKNVK